MLAHHYVQALEYAGETDRGSDYLAARAIGALQDAGDQALALNAYQSAARLYETALEALDPSDEEIRCKLLLSLGEAEGRAGNTAAANESLLDAAEIARRLGLSRELAHAANDYGGRIVWARGSLDTRLVPLLEEGLAGLSQEEVELRARLLARLAGALRDEHTRDRRDALSREAVELARRAGNPAALAGALDGRAFAILAPDTVAECIALGSELREVAERIGDRERVVDGNLERVAALVVSGEVGEAEADLAAAYQLAEQLGQPAYIWDVGAAQAMLALAAGRFREGEELAERFSALGQPAVGASAIAVYQVQRYTLCDFLGRVGEVEPAIRDLIATQPTRLIFRCVLAHLHARLGRLREAEQALRELAEDDFSIVPFDQEWLFCMSLLAETSALVGDAESASVLYRLLLPWAQLNVADLSEGIRGSVSRYLGLLAAAMRRWDEAERHLEDAVAMNGRMGTRPWLAHTQSDYARMLLGRDGPGDRERAQELFGAAIATYRDLGMDSYAAKADAIMREVGTTA